MYIDVGGGFRSLQGRTSRIYRYQHLRNACQPHSLAVRSRNTSLQSGACSPQAIPVGRVRGVLRRGRYKPASRNSASPRVWLQTHYHDTSRTQPPTTFARPPRQSSHINRPFDPRAWHPTLSPISAILLWGSRIGRVILTRGIAGRALVVPLGRKLMQQVQPAGHHLSKITAARQEG